MNKIMISIIFCTLTLLDSNGTTIESKENTEIIPQEQAPSLMEGAFLRSLGTTILDIMVAHGDKQLFQESRIEKITKNNTSDSYDVTLRVIGFVGAHNPPYKLIRMTVRIPGDENEKYSVLSYSSQPIRETTYPKHY